jgi:cytochrome bd ubiquinol oxidase subunit I
LNKQYQQQYGSGNYVPNVFIQYWSMRVMAYLATIVVLLSLWGAWLLRRKTLDTARWFLRIAVWAAAFPFLMNTAGWMLTENGRQPWIVQGLMQTSQGVSPSVDTTTVWISLIVFASLYLVLAVVAWALMARYARMDPAPAATGTDEGLATSAMTY